jgi:hypothetical protein
MAAYTIGSPDGILIDVVYRSMKRGGIHLVVGSGEARVTFLASFWLFRFCGVKGM